MWVIATFWVGEDASYKYRPKNGLDGYTISSSMIFSVLIPSASAL